MEDKVMALMLDEEMDENVTTIKVIGAVSYTHLTLPTTPYV